MASHVYNMTPEAMPAHDGHDPAVFLMFASEPVRNGLDWQHGPFSPAQARVLALQIIEAADAAEDMAQ
jgi:hypothetical protein